MSRRPREQIAPDREGVKKHWKIHLASQSFLDIALTTWAIEALIYKGDKTCNSSDTTSSPIIHVIFSFFSSKKSWQFIYNEEMKPEGNYDFLHPNMIF